MCCLVTTLVFLGPRAAVLFWWLVQPVRWQVAFHNVLIWPVLGLLFLPWTTLAYVLAAPTGSLVTPSAWAVVILGLIVDLIAYAGGGYGNRGRAQGYVR